MKTVTLSDGYNGHTVECHAVPIKTDGNLVQLRVAGSYTTRWARKSDIRAMHDPMQALRI